MLALLCWALAVVTSPSLPTLDCPVTVVAIHGDLMTLSIPACNGEPAYVVPAHTSEMPSCARVVGAWLACESIGYVPTYKCYPYIDGHGEWCPDGKAPAKGDYAHAVADAKSCGTPTSRIEVDTRDGSPWWYAVCATADGRICGENVSWTSPDCAVDYADDACVELETLRPGTDEPDAIGVRVCGTDRVYIGELYFPDDGDEHYSPSGDCPHGAYRDER